MDMLITGAGRGLGLELAKEALRRGHRVIAGVRRLQHHEQLGRLEETYGQDRLTIARLDVEKEDSIAEAAELLKAEGRTLGAIINNAAVLLGRNVPVEELDIEELSESFEVNLFGPVRVVKHFRPLLKQPEASIINISSEAGSLTHAYPNDYPYGMTKAAMNMFTQQLSSLLSKDGIQVLSVHPGWMRTDMGGQEAAIDPQLSAQGILDLIERKIPAKSGLHFVDYKGKEMTI